MKQFLDKSWRLKHLYKIVDKDSRTIKLNLNSIQKKIIENKANRKMILKARQFGVSTGCIVDFFDDTIFTPNMTTVILAHENDAVTKLFRIVKRAYDNLPPQIQPIVDRGGGSKHEMYFPEINSRIYCDLESRGDTINRLHVSEAAFMKDAAKLNSTLQAVPILTGKVNIETTPNGVGNHFYDRWIDKDSVFERLFFPWYVFEPYKLPAPADFKWTDEELELKKKAKKLFNVDLTPEQICFRRYKKSELKFSATDSVRVTFEQEYPEDDVSCFLTSGNAVMDLIEIRKKMDNAKEPIKSDSFIKIYELPNKFTTYCCGVDTAEGVGGDFSVAVMIDAKSRKVVAKLRGHFKPYEFAHKVNDLCQFYKSAGKGPPLLAVERNNHGHAVLLELREHIGYENLYQHTDERLGWKTDSITRPVMINAFIDAIENNILACDDLDILGECLTLINNTQGKIQAADGKHDDCIVATAIALQMIVNGSSLDVWENIEKRILL